VAEASEGRESETLMVDELLPLPIAFTVEVLPFAFEVPPVEDPPVAEPPLAAPPEPPAPPFADEDEFEAELAEAGADPDLDPPTPPANAGNANSEAINTPRSLVFMAAPLQLLWCRHEGKLPFPRFFTTTGTSLRDN
jgi:hypothetical protein